MPIKRLRNDARAAFPCIGKLRKGGERPESGRQPGPDLEYFRFTSDDPEIERLFTEEYGEEPQAIDLFIPYAKVDNAFTSWQEHWQAGGLVHRCDGETCTLWLKKDGSYSREAKPCPGGCKEVGRLSVVLPCLYREGHVGYVTVETHSINDILAIYGSLLATVEARGREDLIGIGFTLKRVEREISTPGSNGKRARRKKWLIELEPATEWVLAQLEEAKRQALPQLPEGAVIDDVTGEVLMPMPSDDYRSAARDRMGGAGLPFPGSEPIDAGFEDLEDPGSDLLESEPVGWATFTSPQKRRLFAMTGKLNLSKEAMRAEFGVEHMTDWLGSADQAYMVAEILDYATVKRTLTLDDLHNALGVDAASDWAGNLAGAKKAIDAYIETMSGADAETIETGMTDLHRTNTQAQDAFEEFGDDERP